MNENKKVVHIAEDSKSKGGLNEPYDEGLRPSTPGGSGGKDQFVIGLMDEVKRLREAACIWYNNDGDPVRLDSPEEVILRRKQATSELKRLKKLEPACFDEVDYKIIRNWQHDNNRQHPDDVFPDGIHRIIARFIIDEQERWNGNGARFNNLLDEIKQLESLSIQSMVGKEYAIGDYIVSGLYFWQETSGMLRIFKLDFDEDGFIQEAGQPRRFRFNNVMVPIKEPESKELVKCPNCEGEGMSGNMNCPDCQTTGKVKKQDGLKGWVQQIESTRSLMSDCTSRDLSTLAKALLTVMEDGQ